MKKRLEDMISYVFGKYDMRTGIDNKIRMEKLLQFCPAADNLPEKVRILCVKSE